MYIIKRTHPECVAHEAINEWVDTGVSHSQPVRGEKHGHVHLVAIRVHQVDEQLRMESEDEVEALQRKPGKREKDNHQNEHLNNLSQ